MMRFTIVILATLLCTSASAQTKEVEKTSDEDIMAAAEKLVEEGSANKPSEKPSAATLAESAKPVEATKPVEISKPLEAKSESEIPAFGKSEKLTKSEGTLIWRLVASLAFIAVIGGALIFAGRKWKMQKNKGGERARIEILHQLHMGPKRSIALIRVAGEAILIGCTDQSVNMLKSVTLIDDELEGVLGTNFNQFLEDEFAIEDVRSAIAPRA